MLALNSFSRPFLRAFFRHAQATPRLRWMKDGEGVLVKASGSVKVEISQPSS